ncbi:MAG: helix-turn-helix domain-containing protein [Candidatus Gracilibacteria bacterium]|jgi:sugar-specific transcriptional regulator TrmB
MLNKVDLQRIFQQLKQFGCNQTEASIYVECLELGTTTVMEVSAKLNLNRITCHSAVKELLKKGLLFETLKGKRRLIAAEDPDILKRLLQTKYNELKLMESNLDYITKILNSVKNVSRSVPTVKFYEGVDGFKKMLEETLTAKNGVRVFTYVDIFSKLLEPAYLENYFARRGAKNIYTKLIFPPCDFATRVNKKAKEYKIEVRLLPAELKWTSGFFNWDDKVALMSYTESQMTCTIIQNPDIADFFRNIIFELSWKQAVPCA